MESREAQSREAQPGPDAGRGATHKRDERDERATGAFPPGGPSPDLADGPSSLPGQPPADGGRLPPAEEDPGPVHES